MFQGSRAPSCLPSQIARMQAQRRRLAKCAIIILPRPPAFGLIQRAICSLSQLSGLSPGTSSASPTEAETLNVRSS